LYTEKNVPLPEIQFKTVVKRRYIALIFTANLLLSVYGIVPHHHHEGIPCFVLSEKCRHDSREGGQSCLFEQKSDAVYKHADEKCGDALCGLHHPDAFPQAAVFSVFDDDFSLVRETVPLPESSFLINYCCDFAGSGRGLRGPPR
jgi:hypothetical protein